MAPWPPRNRARLSLHAGITVTDDVNPTNDWVIDCGEQIANSSREHTITLTNDGAVDLTIGAIAVADPLEAPFSIVADQCSNQALAKDAGCSLTVRCAPTVTSTFSDTFDIPSDDPTNPVVTFAVEAHAVVCGDANDDSRVTAADALVVLKTAVGAADCTQLDTCICNVDSTGNITATDALMALKNAVGLDVALNCNCGNTSAPGLDTDRAVSVTMGAGGGSLKTTASDGTVYHVFVAPGTLEKPTPITATPYLAGAAGGDLTPIGHGLYLEPAGATFDFPVTVSADLATPLPPGLGAGILHVTPGGAGALLNPTVHGQTFTVSLDHFSSLIPVEPTEAQLLGMWGSVVLEIGTYGESIDRTEALVLMYLFVQADGSSYPGIDLQAWNIEIRTHIQALVDMGQIDCDADQCLDGKHLLSHARNIASVMLMGDLEQHAADVEAACGYTGVDVRATSWPDWRCQAVVAGESIDLRVVPYTAGGPVAGVEVEAYVANGGTLSATTGLTDASGVWTTTYTTPSAFGSEQPEIHVRLPGSCDPTAEVVFPINFGGHVAGSGPAFGWGLFPGETTPYPGKLSASVGLTGGEDDEGTNGFGEINTCDLGFFSDQGAAVAGSAAFAYGSGHFSARFYMSNGALSFVVDGSAFATGSYAATGYGGQLEGVYVFRKEDESPFPLGALLHVSVMASRGSMDWGIQDDPSRSQNYPFQGYNHQGVLNAGESESFDVVLSEGTQRQPMLLYLRATNGAAVTISTQCRNCGP